MTRLLVLVAALLMAVPAFASPLVTMSPRKVPVGGIALVRVAVEDSAGPIASANARWRGGTVKLFKSEEGLVGLLGVDLDARPGPHSLRVEGSLGRGDGFVAEVSFSVVSKKYPVQRLTLPKKMVTPPKEVLGRIIREKRLLESIFAKISPRRYFRGGFQRPVPGVITSPFGVRRILNGKPRSPHSGVDLKAKEGDPVLSTNSGVVVLVRELYYSGNAVIVDHGLGLYSMYFHLARALVKEGDKIDAGGVIGAAGMTGRSTGPHLHFGVRLTGARVDPLYFLELEPI